MRALKQVGVDCIKVHRRTPRDDYFAIVDEAKKQRSPLWVISPSSCRRRKPRTLARRSTTRTRCLKVRCCQDVRRWTWPRSSRDFSRTPPTSRFSPLTDKSVLAPPGFILHDELTLLAAAGLTPLDVLKSATLNPAILLKRDADLGSVTAGKLADLVLLDANPLDDIHNTQRIRAVVATGKLLDRQALDNLLARGERLASHM